TESFEFPNLWQHVAGQMDVHVRAVFAQNRAGMAFVLSVEIRVEETDCDRADASVCNLLRGSANVVLVKRFNHRAGMIDPLRYRQAPFASNDLLRCRKPDIKQDFLETATEFQQVAETARGQHRGRNTPMLEHRIGRYGRAEVDHFDV